MSECVECGTKSWLVKDVSTEFAISDYNYPLCVKCKNVERRWKCTPCERAFLAKIDHGLTSYFPPKCPQCKKNTSVSAELIPVEARGNEVALKSWRSAPDGVAREMNNSQGPSNPETHFVAETKNMRLFKAEYLGGHPSATQAEVVILGCHDEGLRVYSRKTYAVLFDMAWPTIARIQHIHVPKDKPITQGEMYMANYGATGRGGAITDWANAYLAIRNTFGRDKHIVSIVLRTADGFEGAVGFEDKEGERIAKNLTAERLRHGGSAAPVAQAVAAVPSGDDTVSKIKELAALRDAGIVTSQEFEAKKAELLARL